MGEARSDLEVLKGGSGQEDNEEALDVSVVEIGLLGGTAKREEAHECSDTYVMAISIAREASNDTLDSSQSTLGQIPLESACST